MYRLGHPPGLPECPPLDMALAPQVEAISRAIIAQVSDIFGQFEPQMSDMKALVSNPCSSSPRLMASSMETPVSMVRHKPMVSVCQDEASPSPPDRPHDGQVLPLRSL